MSLLLKKHPSKEMRKKNHRDDHDPDQPSQNKAGAGHADSVPSQYKALTAKPRKAHVGPGEAT